MPAPTDGQSNKSLRLLLPKLAFKSAKTYKYSYSQNEPLSDSFNNTGNVCLICALELPVICPLQFFKPVANSGAISEITWRQTPPPLPLLGHSSARWRKRKMVTQTELFSTRFELWATIWATLILAINLFPKYLLKMIVVRAAYGVLLYHVLAHLSFLNVFSWHLLFSHSTIL